MAPDRLIVIVVDRRLRYSDCYERKPFYGPVPSGSACDNSCSSASTLTACRLTKPGSSKSRGEDLTTRHVRNRHPHGRGQLPDPLPRIEIEYDLPDAEKPCPCCGEVRQQMGHEISEQLEYQPASFKMLRHVHHKYLCRHCEAETLDAQIAIAAKPI
jgi:zinc-finger binding domain of transposase IS66